MIDLPSVGRGKKQPDQVIQVVLGKNEALELKLAGKTVAVTLKDLAKTVTDAQRGMTNSAVVISADRNIKYESVVRVMDTLQRAQVQRVGLSVQLEP